MVLEEVCNAFDSGPSKDVFIVFSHSRIKGIRMLSILMNMLNVNECVTHVDGCVGR